MEEKIVMFIGKNNTKTITPLLLALEGEDSELSKRLKYTKEILAHMMVSSGIKEKK